MWLKVSRWGASNLFKGLLTLGGVLVHASHVIVLLLLLRLRLLFVIIHLLVAHLHEPLLFDIWCHPASPNPLFEGDMLHVIGGFRSVMRRVELCSVWNGNFSLSPSPSFLPSENPVRKAGFYDQGSFRFWISSPPQMWRNEGWEEGWVCGSEAAGFLKLQPTAPPIAASLTPRAAAGARFTLVRPCPAPSYPPPPTSPPPPDSARRAETQAQRASQGRAGRGPGG